MDIITRFILHGDSVTDWVYLTVQENRAQISLLGIIDGIRYKDKILDTLQASKVYTDLLRRGYTKVRYDEAKKQMNYGTLRRLAGGKEHLV